MLNWLFNFVCPGKSFFGSYASYDGSRSSGYSDPLLDPFDQMVPASISPMGSRMSPRNQSGGSDFSAGGSDQIHLFSRKVFVGGLPPDIDEGSSPKSRTDQVTNLN